LFIGGIIWEIIEKLKSSSKIGNKVTASTVVHKLTTLMEED
jgi:hypothetical protein